MSECRLGLRRGIVRLEEHSDNWSAAYKHLARELTRLAQALGAKVEHVGSTAVPDLPAKPIIDVAIGVPAGNKGALLTALRGAGYADRGDKADLGGYLFVVTDPGDPELRLAHVHVVELSSEQWHDYLRFRDLLRADPELRRRYADLKKAKAIQFASDRAAYTTAKEQFICRVLEGQVSGDRG